MKSIINRSLFLSVSFVFCAIISLSAQNWWGNGITGKGPIIEKELELASFNGFDLGISGDVVVQQGSSQKVRVEGQENIIDNLKTEVKNGIWKIRFKENTGNYKKFVVHITLPTVNSVVLSGSGNVSSNGQLSSNELTTYLSGSGNIDLDVNAEDLTVKLSGSGSIAMNGKANQANMKISGSGNIRTYDLAAQDCEIRISGSGNAKVHAVNSIRAHVSGSGNIYYKGNPEKVSSKVTGSGDVASRN